MKVTLHDVAEEAGFSVTTVSRALGGYSDVNEETRRHIRNIAEKLGYVPNQVARNLQSQKANSIGLVIPLDDDFTNSFFMELLTNSARQLATYDYNLLISARMPGREELEDYHRLVTGGHVDGIIIARVLRNDPRIAYLNSRQFPFVVYGHDDHQEHAYIDADSLAGTYALTRHFIELGHHHIAMIGGPAAYTFAQKRLAGFREALAESNIQLPDTYVVSSQLDKRSGEHAMQELLTLAHRPTAVVCCNDLQALGAIQAIQQAGLRVGADLAVGGFDDIPQAQNAVPPLTTVRQPIADISTQLIDMLMSKLNQKTIPNPQVLMQPQLVVRASSGSRLKH